ncbi:uncharacterized protein HMPREF1541_09329 [Cyphellophora europaea CBS 101466]|uniref:Uncharacterized protein n=1 Tax=Cyphellophora europaea (strain CBS 101466) TaxID=1220924 RepID=W2S9Y7_CYPE1|nr:uncharacterized protein HMPREF1541_09329 [Cyphellophora europaea CBS 101466]ETN45497.1 hypothetical protein HMPREF1541_09329 [Cyphellophora europaea CBS 101466]
MVNTFTRVFPIVFVVLFFGAFSCLVLVPKLRQCKACRRIRKRNFDLDTSDNTELTTLPVNANINRISARDFPTKPIPFRDHHRRPAAARLARRSERFSSDVQNPFADPPRYRPYYGDPPPTPYSRSIRSLSTPTRAGRHSSPSQNNASMTRGPSLVITDHSDPFDSASSQNDMRPSQSLTFSDHGDRPFSVVSLPDPTYQPTKLSIPDLAKCEPRSAGQAPPLGRKLEQFPMPKSGSAHLHPNAVFTQMGAATPPTPPATVTRPNYANTGAKIKVSEIRQLFDPNKASLDVVKPDIRASSIYSRDEEGRPLLASDSMEEMQTGEKSKLPRSYSRPLPKGKAPGGAEWL